MLNAKRMAAHVVALACLAGGMSAAHADLRRVGFDRAAGAAISTIDVLEAVQQQPLVLLPQTTHREGPPPARGTMPAVGNSAPTQRAISSAGVGLVEAFQRRNSSLPSEFTRQLASALQSRGYDARVLRGQQPRSLGIGEGVDISGVTSNADAVLYSVLRFAGYREDAAAGGVVPMVGVDAYLFDRKTGKLLYRQVFNQGYRLVSHPEVESLPIPGQAKFANRTTLLANADGAADGLVQAMQPVALRIADQLNR
jgi:hypothetical protein